MSVPATVQEVSLARAVPDLSAATPRLKANADPLNTPPATGALTNSGAPAGTLVTSTGRTTEATQTYLASKLNILNVGTTPSRPTS